MYQIYNVQSNKRYVGSSANIDRRWREHLKRLKRGDHENGRLQNAWNKYGSDQFQFSVLLECDPIAEMLIPIEQHFIDGLRPEYNILLTAGTSLGHKHPPEYGAAISARLTGRKMGPQSAEHRAKRAAAITGKKRAPFSAEWRAKLGAASRGRIVSAETRAKLSARGKGRVCGPLSAEHRAKLSAAQMGIPKPRRPKAEAACSQ